MIARAVKIIFELVIFNMNFKLNRYGKCKITKAWDHNLRIVDPLAKETYSVFIFNFLYFL